MLNKLHYLFMAIAIWSVFGCSETTEAYLSADKTGPKPGMDLTIPTVDYRYGDRVKVVGLLTDEQNLEHYEMLLLNSRGDTLATKYQMLLGQSFNVDDNIQIPLPGNAETDNLQLVVKLDNTRNGEAVQTFDIPAVTTPVFDRLNLVLGNGSVIELLRKGDIFTTLTEQVFPAGIKGIISTTTGKTGIYWGTQAGEIATMTRDSIRIGGDVEASYTVSFDPVTFALTFGERHIWSPLPNTDNYYILGTISGHWQDGEIKTEREKMKMAGFESNADAYYTWTAPEGDNPETGMWGSTAAGVFRLKKGGTENYILWNGSRIVQTTADNPAQSFPVTAGGSFTIKAVMNNNICTAVEISGSGKSLIFANDKVTVNGKVAGPTVGFAGNTLARKAGTNYIYEGMVTLEKGQKIDSDFDLSGFTANPDIFNGGGNATWTLKGAGGQYYVRMDIFSGACYICPMGGYPDVLYMDGWSWAPTSGSTAVVWDAANVLPLVRTATGTYEATFYDFGWGGNVAFYLTHPTTGNSYRLPNTRFKAYVGSEAGGFLLPAAAGYYKVVIDLKDGVTVAADGTVTPKGNADFVIDYIAQ